MQVIEFVVSSPDSSAEPVAPDRVVLLILLIMSKKAAWLLEQPSSSTMMELPRFKWLCREVAYV